MEFFFFAACIGAVAILFAVMSFFYKYVDLSTRQPAGDLTEETNDESSALVFDSQTPQYTHENGEGAVPVSRAEEKYPSESEL